MAAKVYRGKAPLTLVLVGSDVDRAYVQVYRGAPVPGGASAEELARLEAEGFIESGDQVVGLQIDASVASRKA